jgi:molecular chaperone HscA
MLLEITEPGANRDEPENKSIAIGIDLGTTNSVVAMSEGQICKTFADGDLDIIPSVVLLDGSEIHSAKRLMGKGVDDELAVRTSAEILKKLKKMAEDSLGGDVSKAVITVPAYFDDAARMATKNAAKLAGLEVLRLINEPTAAALAYGLDNDAEGIYAVYDLGGGTFDISILRMQKGVFKVLSTAGDTELGGDDFDNAIAEKLGCDSKKARAIKEQLSEMDEVEGLSRSDFEELINPLLSKTINTCMQAVSDAGVELAEINGVVLVGGSTKTPFVRKRVGGYFAQEPLANIDPDRVVAFGAAIQAENLTRGGGALLLDVTPLSLGIETYGGLMERVIERNSPIPVAKSQEFTTYQDNQTAMKIHILQGEREMVEQCRSLAHFDLRGIPAMASGLAKIKVTFTLDADGLLTVSAIEEETGTQQEIEVKPTYGLPPEKIENMLRESFSHAKEDIMARLLAESRIEAEQLLRTIEKAIKEDADLLEQSESEEIAGVISDLKTAIKGTNREEIDHYAQSLDKTCSAFADKRVNKALSGALKGQNIDNVDLNESANNVVISK